VGASEGVVEREEREMIHKVFELEDTLVRSVMVPRTDMFCLDVETPVSEILPALREQLHSRVPVYEGSIDVIVGILYTKDLLAYLDGLPDDFELRAHLHPPYFVPESKRADDLLREFQKRKVHMAIVVDEYGGTAGLVTIEDLLEEIVGEIQDEYDVEEPLFQKISEDEWIFDAMLRIEEVNDEMGINLMADNGIETLGGFIFERLGEVPEVGDCIDVDHLTLEVVDVDGKRIKKVRITREGPAEEPTGNGQVE
jgi:CBS domain containing-hemolysin-like protein